MVICYLNSSSFQEIFVLAEVTVQIFQIGSIAPGAYLFEAERKFKVRNQMWFSYCKAVNNLNIQTHCSASFGLKSRQLLIQNVWFVFMLQQQNKEANDYIDSIADQMMLAVEQCIEAAGNEYEPAKQKDLLRVCQ